ncbi:hypothetical protein [Streptomyces sp. CC224B]|uniref:hypothetical protein n=1 Tax=Streptomyces sp. CC224B TaxID=3044571 RepID=UPI0024A82974|nr:hypothetical protein [Streptomyces sp. CC224B]
MGSMNPQEARTALDQATSARARGAAHGMRPGWYYPAMGLSLFLAFASFSLGLGTFGVPLGAVIGPVTLDMVARNTAGASPYRVYTTPATRGISNAFVMLTAALAAVGLVLDRVADLRWPMAVCGVAALVVTVVTGRRLDRARAAELRETEGRG